MKMGSYKIKNGEVAEYKTKQEAENATIDFLKECFSNYDLSQRSNITINITRFIGAGRNEDDVSWQIATRKTQGFKDTFVPEE